MWHGFAPAEKSSQDSSCLERCSSSAYLCIDVHDVHYVTHAGLLRTAQRRRCHSIRTSLQKDVSDPIACRWVFKATVYKTSNSRGFVAYGDADPSNVSTLVRGAEMRMAETRAVDRALRKAYGIGLCSVEELGSFSNPPRPIADSPHSNGSHGSNGSNNGHPRLRDQLCLLIRKYELDPVRVKPYAADFCGTEVLRDAGRDSPSSRPWLTEQPRIVRA